MAAKAPASARKCLVGGLFLLIAGLALGLAFGSVSVPIRELPGILFGGPNLDDASIHTDVVLNDASVYTDIVWKLRFPRVLLAFLEGASLGIAGASMQGLFRNPMADPYVLGVSSGASLGAVLGIVIGIGGALGVWSLPILAFAGAMASIILVYALATHGGRTDTWTLLLSGIAVSSLVSSAIAFIMVMFRERTDEIVFWTMGALSRASWPAFWSALPYTVPGVFILWRYAGLLNAFSFGEEPAFHMGVPVEKVKRTILWVSSLIVAGGVAFTGPIGFIGLIVPHGVRLVAGPDHRRLLPLSGLMGGNALLFADLLARTVASPREIPVGVITAMAGAPFFLYLLQRARRGKR